MTSADPQGQRVLARPKVSRAPVVVVVLGLLLAVGLVLLGAALAAAPAPPPDIAQPGTAASPRPVNVIMRDYRFDPTPLYLVRGETVRLSIFNGGLVDHELVLGDERVQSAWSEADALATPPGPFASAPVARVPVGTGGWRALLGSGAAATLQFVVPATGDLLMICHLPGHAERGMVGEVTFATP